MFDKFIFSFFFLLLISTQAQVGIGTESVSASEALKIGSKLNNESGSRGLLIPRVILENPINSNAPVVNPALGLLLYNSDPEKEGFYYYTGGATGVYWEPVFSEIILKDKIVPVKTLNSISSAGANQAAGAGTAVTYTIGERYDARAWVKIPGMERTINLTSPSNNVTVMAEGTVQINNPTARSGQGNVCVSWYWWGGCARSINTDAYLESQSFAVGLFLNGELKSVRTYIMLGYKYITCLTQNFNIKMNLENLSAGTPHKIEIYAITRSNIDGFANSMTWAGPVAGCSNSNTFMNRGAVSVQMQNF